MTTDKNVISAAALLDSIPDPGRFPILQYSFKTWSHSINMDNWLALMRKYPRSVWANSQGWCPLCHHTCGEMYVLKYDNKEYSIPLASPCIHHLLEERKTIKKTKGAYMDG